MLEREGTAREAVAADAVRAMATGRAVRLIGLRAGFRTVERFGIGVRVERDRPARAGGEDVRGMGRLRVRAVRASEAARDFTADTSLASDAKRREDGLPVVRGGVVCVRVLADERPASRWEDSLRAISFASRISHDDTPHGPYYSAALRGE